MSNPSVSVIIPIYNQQSFILRAINSVLLQTMQDWEIIIINDGSSDSLYETIAGTIQNHDRIFYHQCDKNRGLGHALNLGISCASFPYIAYLPADDVYFSNHLYSLVEVLERNEQAILSYGGLKYNYLDSSNNSGYQTTNGIISGNTLQLVQVLHRKVATRWVEREELVTDDLNRMYWDRLAEIGSFEPSRQVTSEWISHPLQRHRLINELFGGGLYRYKTYYQAHQPLRFQSTNGPLIDEQIAYESIKYKTNTFNSETGLKILLVGELAFNAERICALEELGHKLYGLWLDKPYFFNTVGPLPFGHVEDVPRSNWRKRIEEIQPDIIYALLNFMAVPFAHEVLHANLGIPFVWHFKESPFYCRQHGLWDKLVDLYQEADGQIFINDENKLWFDTFLSYKQSCFHVMDGDLPSRFYFKDNQAPLISELDGQIHTVVCGRPFGIEPQDVYEMSKFDINLHVYGDYNHRTYSKWIDESFDLAPDHLHVYYTCPPDSWTTELSQYDAGWLHFFKSSNEREIVRMDWSDLNYPARMNTLAAAGLPMIQYDNSGHIVATQNLSTKFEIGVNFSTFEELASKLKNKQAMGTLRKNCWRNRLHFSFDHHVEDLVKFFRHVIQNHAVN